MKAIDLFAGCGGLSLGFLQAGYSIDRAVEYDPVIANTYQKNHPEVKVIVDDIKNIDAAGTFKLGDADVIIGGPPCQGFSMAGARIRHGFIDDPRNYLFKHYFNVVRTVKPKVFVMENVKGMQNMQGGKIFKEILNIFSDPKMNDGVPYTLYHRVIKAVEFGVPQKRERLIIVGTTIPGVLFDWLWNETCADITNEYPSYFSPVCVRDAIGNLPPVTEDGVIDNPAPQNDYQRFLSCNRDTLTKVSTPYEVKEKATGTITKDIVLGKNLFILGTMNTADKSIDAIDYAIRRRFIFIDSPADRNVVMKCYQNTSGNPDEKSIELLLFDAVQHIFDDSRFFNNEYQKSDVRIGHTYFLRDRKRGYEDAIIEHFVFQVVPILREYVKDGILDATENLVPLEHSPAEIFDAGSGEEQVTLLSENIMLYVKEFGNLTKSNATIDNEYVGKFIDELRKEFSY